MADYAWLEDAARKKIISDIGGTPPKKQPVIAPSRVSQTANNVPPLLAGKGGTLLNTKIKFVPGVVLAGVGAVGMNTGINPIYLVGGFGILVAGIAFYLKK